jgi:hypothetical protein
VPEAPESPVEPFVEVDGCWAACVEGESGCVGVVAGGLAVGGGLAGVGGLGGTTVAASSKAANGCEAASWLSEDACVRDCDVSETAAGKSGAILDILDTREPPGATSTRLSACNPRASGAKSKKYMSSKAYKTWRATTDGSLYRAVGNSCRMRSLGLHLRLWQSAAAAHIIRLA